MAELRSGRAPRPGRRPWLYLVLVLGLSVPFYFLNLTRLPTPLGLPPSFLMIVVPLLVALGMAHQEAGVRQLFIPFGLPRGTRSGRWLVFSILLVPTLVALMHLIGVLLGQGRPGMPPVSPPSLLAVAGLYLLGAIPEEVGWTMYATRPLQERHGPVLAGLVIGSAWGLWHAVPFVWQGRDWVWIVAQIGVSIVLRVIMGQVFAHTGGSLLPALIIHASINFYPELLPGGLGGYRPEILFPLGLVAAAAVTRLGCGSAGSAMSKTRMAR